METVKLHWIQTQINDPFTSDTYAIADSGFNVTQNSYVNDEEEYTLPDGYYVGETTAGEIAIFNQDDNYCILDRYNKCPRLSSSSGIVLLKKQSPTW